MTNDKFEFKTSDDAQQAAIYSSNPLEVEAANKFLMKTERSADRLTIANKAQLELGQYYVPLRHAQGTDQIVASLRVLAKQYSWPLRPSHALVWFRAQRYLRQLKK